MAADRKTVGASDLPSPTIEALPVELATSDAKAWLFVCECDRADCVERVMLALVEYEELRSRRALVLAPGHRGSRVAQAKRAGRELREDARALQAQAAQQSRRARNAVEQAEAQAARSRRLIALGKANEVRIGRAMLKRRLHAGEVELKDILAAPPRCASTATVLDLLLALPKVGPVRARRLLTAARVSETVTVGRLTERQRGQLIDRLRG